MAKFYFIGRLLIDLRGEVTRRIPQSSKGGHEDANKSIGQLYSSQLNDFVSLLNEWVLKMRQISSMITESSKLVQALPHLASTMLMPTSVTDKWGAPDASSLEEAHKGITYVATLTESKVVEGIVEKFLTGATPTVPIAIYEWLGYTLVATPRFVKNLVNSLHSLQKLKPTAELVVAVSEMVGRLKAPPLDANHIWHRKKLILRATEAIYQFHANFSTLHSQLQVNNNRIECFLRVVKIMEMVVRSAFESYFGSAVNLDLSFLQSVLERHQAKDFPKKSEILEVVSSLSYMISLEYSIPLKNESPPSKNSTTQAVSSVVSPVPQRAQVPSALLAPSRSLSPLRSSTNSLTPSPPSSPSPTSPPSSAAYNRITPPPRSYSPSPMLSRSVSSSLPRAPGSPRLSHRSTVNLSALPAPPSPPDMTRSPSFHSIPVLTDENNGNLSNPVNMSRVPSSIAVAIEPSPQAPSQTPHSKATKASPSKKIPPPIQKPLATELQSPRDSPSSSSVPSGLLGDWDTTIGHFLSTYFQTSLQYCNSAREQLVIYRKRLHKLNELLRNTQSHDSSSGFGISKSAIGEQFADHAQQALALVAQVEQYEAESNQFIDYILDQNYLSRSTLLSLDLALVRKIFATLLELHSTQSEIDDELNAK